METQIFFPLSHTYDKMEKTYFSNFKNVITYELKVLSEEHKIYPLYLQLLI